MFLNMHNLDMPFVRCATEVGYVRCMREMLRTDILFESDVVDLSHGCLPRSFSSVYLIREVSTGVRDLDFEVRQRS